jgi:acyl dehydratase
MALYLEDLTPGLTVEGGPITVDEEAAIAFARQFDPQPFHTDPVAARASFFGGLVVSGWHTAALSMRMLADTRVSQIVNGLIGLEARHIRWPNPTRPGDTLTVVAEILENRPSRSQPGWGTAVVRWTTRNQGGETVMVSENVIWVQRRG